MLCITEVLRHQINVMWHENGILNKCNCCNYGSSLASGHKLIVKSWHIVSLTCHSHLCLSFTAWFLAGHVVYMKQFD